MSTKACRKSWSLAAALIPNLLQLAHLWAAFCYSLDAKAVTLHVPLCLTGNHNILCSIIFRSTCIICCQVVCRWCSPTKWQCVLAQNGLEHVHVHQHGARSQVCVSPCRLACRMTAALQDVCQQAGDLRCFTPCSPIQSCSQVGSGNPGAAQGDTRFLGCSNCSSNSS